MLSNNIAHAKIVKYQFDINTKMVNFTGTQVQAMTINNQLPGPTIEATVGDILEVTFNNKMNEDTSIHWHGVLLPNNQDGVPYLTTQPIAAHSSFTYRYEIKHHGTYWYHSHTGLQEQCGIYGSLVFHPKNGERVKADKDYVIVLSDWTNESPKRVLANLKKDGDYYALKKQTVQSWDKVLKYGSESIKNRLRGSLSRMGSMDVSDIRYDVFLSNGKRESYLKAKPKEMIRIRLINAASSSYFNVEFAGAPMTIVAADGMDVEPIKVKQLRIAIAETYDVLIPILEKKSYEFRATSEDSTGKTSVFLGEGKKVLAPDIPKPNLFLVDHNQMHAGIYEKDINLHGEHNKHMSANMHSNNSSKSTIHHMANYDHLRAIENTSFKSDKPVRKITLNLTGSMERYVWSFDDLILAESDKILIQKGEVVQFILQNKTMMHHPIHLHGHFFRVLNKQGERSPLKHTVNVPPMDNVIIEVHATEEKDWFFHCHNLYHMETGMARVVSYADTTQVTPKIFSKLAPDNWYFSTNIAALSNMTMGMLRASNTRNAFKIMYDYNYSKEYDVDVVYARSLTRFFDIYVGGNFERENKNSKSETSAILGIHYILPLLIESDLRINSKNKVRLSFGSDIPLTERIKFSWSFNTDKEYNFDLTYEISKQFSLITAYDSSFKWGVGIRCML